MTKPKKVLIVDASRVVRASLARYLRHNFNVCEESGGESAWQSLVLDSSIVAVVSGLDISSLDGSGLIERIRASKLARLNRLPFFLLASDSLPEAERIEARRLGVSDFVPKSSAGLAIEHFFGKLKDAGSDASGEASDSMPASPASGLVSGEFGGQSDIGLSDFVSRMGTMRGLADDASLSPEVEVGDAPRTVPATTRCLQERLDSAKEGKPAGVLVFGLDGYDDFLNRYGRELAETVVVKFLRLLASKIRADEGIIQLAEGRIGIISSMADREQCASFAWRVCKALAAAHISVRGQRVETTVSAGVAALPEADCDGSAEALLRLATTRLDTAMRAGGNQVVFGAGPTNGGLNQEEFLDRLKELLASASPEAMMSCTGWVNSVCDACQGLREKGKASRCSAGVRVGLCGGRGGANL